MYEEAALAQEPEEEEKKESRLHMDPYEDIKRLDKLIRKQMINFKKSKTDEYKIKYANSIGLITSKKIEIVFTVLQVMDLVKGKPRYDRPK